MAERAVSDSRRRSSGYLIISAKAVPARIRRHSRWSLSRSQVTALQTLVVAHCMWDVPKMVELLIGFLEIPPHSDDPPLDREAKKAMRALRHRSRTAQRLLQRLLPKHLLLERESEGKKAHGETSQASSSS